MTETKNKNTSENEIKFKEFELDELFEKIQYNKLPYQAGDLPSKPNSYYTVPVLTSGVYNNARTKYAPKDKNITLLKNFISITANGVNTGTVYYQPTICSILQDAYGLKIKGDIEISKEQYLYLTAALTKLITGNYSYTNKAGWERIKNLKLNIPVTLDGTPYWQYMTDYIKKIETDYIKKIETYLNILGYNNIKDTEITDEDLKILNNYNNTQFKEFELDELFEIEGSKQVFHANGITKIYDKQVPNSHPYITRTENNNGIRGFIKENNKYLNDKNTISFAQDTFSVFLQKQAYFTGNKVKVLKPKNNKINNLNIVYLLSILSKKINAFSWGTKSSFKSIKSTKINLPITELEEPDYELMENYIKVIEKKQIQKVYKDMQQRLELLGKVK